MEWRCFFRMGKCADPVVKHAVQMDGMPESPSRINLVLREQRFRHGWKLVLPIGATGFESRRCPVFSLILKLLRNEAEFQDREGPICRLVIEGLNQRGVEQ